MTVGLVIVSHSAKLAAGVVELAAQMAPGVPLLGAGGLPDGGLGTDFAAVSDALAGADQGAGVVLLFDLGSARMTAELAVEALADPERAVVADAPLVEGAVAAAVAAAGGANLATVAAAATGADPGPVADSVAGQEVSGPEQSADVVLGNEVGLHARPAAVLARAVSGLAAEVTVRFGDQQADARSVLALLGLAARKGDRLTVVARGTDAAQAIRTVQQLVADGFGE